VPVLDTSEIFVIAAAMAAAAMWLMLPRVRAGAPSRAAGVVLGLASLGFFASQLPGLGDWADGAIVFVFSGVTVAAAAATVTVHKPVYAAIWFGLVLLGTAGLFLVQGAQFLAVATVVVYAGAILVTFLFVLLLAQPEGRAPYDRTSTEALVSATVGAVIVGVLSIALGRALSSPTLAQTTPTAARRAAGVLSEHHVAALGTELFARHLVAVEVAGILLLVALVGATAIATVRKEHKP
jgi:NADH-quinone oxidoreductase subunit J